MRKKYHIIIKTDYTPSSMKSKIREHLKKIDDNSEQNRRIEL